MSKHLTQKLVNQTPSAFDNPPRQARPKTRKPVPIKHNRKHRPSSAKLG